MATPVCTSVNANYDPNDICTACGPIGSACYTLCQSQLAINHVVVPCASNAYNTAAKKAGLALPSTQDIINGITDAILTPIEKALPVILEKSALFIFALILVIVGFVILK